MLLLQLIIYITNPSHADYQPVYKSIIDRDHNNLKKEALNTLETQESVYRKRSLLQLFSTYRDQLYSLDNFKSEVLPFHNDYCLKNKNKKNLCSSFNGYDFFLEQKGSIQKFYINYNAKKLLAYTSHKRTQLKQSKIYFGRALHLIYNKKSSNEHFLLLRELESSRNKVIRQTLNLFKLNNNEICKLSETDVTANSGAYEDVVEFIRVLGPSAPCKNSIIIF